MPLTKAEISRLRTLRDKKHREDTGFFVIEGEKVVGELLAAGYPLLEIYATTEWVERGLRMRSEPVPRPGSTQISRITPDEMKGASHFPTPSNVLAVGKINRVPLAPGESSVAFIRAAEIHVSPPRSTR